jgi:hypothetical protein
MKQSDLSRSRRQFLVLGGASVAGAAALAACSSAPVTQSSGTIASTVTPATAPTTTANAEAVAAGRARIETAASLEVSIANFYAKFLSASYMTDADARTWATMFQTQHESNASALRDLSVSAGGTSSPKPNSYVDEQLIAPAMKVADADKSADALVKLATQLEEAAASTATLAINSLAGADLRQGLMAVGTTNARHAAVWRLRTSKGDLGAAVPDALQSQRDALPVAAGPS